MKLSVKNLGPIQKGEIDLSKRFYVFVGYNNSGKTYMSQLLWSVFKLNNFTKNPFIDIDSLPITLDINLNDINIILEDFEKTLEKKLITDVFNLNSQHFLKNDFQIKFKGDSFEKFNKEKINFSDTEITIHKNESSNKVSIKKGITTNDNNSINISLLHEKSEPYGVGHTLSRKVLDILINQPRSIYFLPANRSFYPTYNKYIFFASKEETDLIHKEFNTTINLEKIKDLSKRPYTLPMNDIIQSMNNRETPTNFYIDLLQDLVNIIGGDVQIKPSKGIAPVEFKLKLKNEQELDMHIVSSSSNQLTTLYLYLKYWAVENDNFLMIDEPEENLHPQNQIALIDLLMRFGNRNSNRVLINTHSPLIAETINNYIQLSNLHEKGIDTEKLIEEKGLQMSPMTDLTPQDFGVYFFDGKSITDYEVKDYGVFFSDFKKAERKVKDMHYILSDEIFNLSEEEVES